MRFPAEVVAILSTEFDIVGANVKSVVGNIKVVAIGGKVAVEVLIFFVP